ncbi:tRNA pseudouridine(38-40) synthase TruA [Reyranella sp. CPCC 100927]|uniref:tRNA pseudouridine(38-40) synthase TruA n=1 Tax=Reyranella sp. CPCC 100927 TaxID=2599616 RepID=UPI0011B449A8|nr:tRNA pseudouridine(38-40) synthase TruA [Reyranella sp. CPCC 100927]TWT15690.1 tRNA pseudouridine(38-40) synthase TruA [Reyranella sp. CPCC 100927]
MTRYKLTLEYDGGPFVGWQRQDNGLSVQQAVEEAVYRFCGERAHVQAAGRTDAGVHARGQVAHVDIAKDTRADTVRDALNYHLKPHPVAVVAAATAAADFHARFSATGRRYLYRIVNRRAKLALDAGRVWLVPVPLDATAMALGAARLLGRHDFTSFRSAACQAASPVKTLDRLDVSRTGDEIRIEAAARSFLHNQVRIMVGTLRLVGEGKWTPDDVTAALMACNRERGGPTAPPDGLYLTDVRYEAPSDAAVGEPETDDAVDDEA